MNRVVIIFFYVFSSYVFSQQTRQSSAFSNTTYGIFCGIHTKNYSNIWGSYKFEFTKIIYRNLSGRLSFGYNNLVSHDGYNVNAYKLRNISNIKRYLAISYKVTKVEYHIFPITIGLKYKIENNFFNPYILSGIGYNLIDPKTFQTRETIQGEFDTFNELPLTFQSSDILLNSSYLFNLGFGVAFEVSSVFSIDIRFLYQLDSELFNTQHISVGILL